VSTGN